MLEILDMPHEIVDTTTKHLKVTDGRIDFQQVAFQYVQGRPVFEGLDLQIKPGERPDNRPDSADLEGLGELFLH